MICPYCNVDNEKKITTFGIDIFNCSKCGGVYYSNSDDRIGKPWYNKQRVIIPDFKTGDSIMCVDNKHPLFLQDGFVKELDHLHARILFKGNKLIWMNQNIIAKIPD